jgi:signal transduction histidine kinase
LFLAIRGLADRFVLFAQAQEHAIDARARATRMRGLFFASVSHDLKGPLNSILGFTQLVATETLERGQKESLHAVHSRAQELLALIETILDAARVEEGHLSLMTEEVSFHQLYEAALGKAAQLCTGSGVQIYDEIERGIPLLLVDRIRIQRALATLLAYSIRSNPDGRMWVRAERESSNRMRIDIDVPKPQHAPTEVEAMLAPTLSEGRREHRGLALGLRLARSVVELHRGTVRVVDRGKKGAMFCVSLPTVDTPLPTASAPMHSIPPDRRPRAVDGHDSSPPSAPSSDDPESGSEMR